MCMSVRGVMMCETTTSPKFDHAFDHFAGFFFEQAFAMTFGDDRADFVFERFFVRLFVLRPATRWRTTSIPRTNQASGDTTALSSPPKRPGEIEERLDADAGERPRQADVG